MCTCSSNDFINAACVCLWFRLLIWRLFLFCNTFKHLNRVDTHRCTHLTSLTTCARPLFNHTSNVYQMFPASSLIISLWTNWTEERQRCSFLPLLDLMKTWDIGWYTGHFIYFAVKSATLAASVGYLKNTMTMLQASWFRTVFYIS